MKQSQREIAQAILWSFEKLEERFRDQAHYEIMGVMQPSPTEWGIHTALLRCADVVKDARQEMRKAIPDV